MNCLALEVDREILVIDCGVTFPRSDLGIDTFHPDFSWLEERQDRIKGLVLTHGHEDHIGAVPYFAARFDAPIWGPPYALELVRLRLEEHGFRRGEVDLRDAAPRKRFEAGRFEIEPVRVTHSIADAAALVVRTSAGTVLHTGDFKLDPTPGGDGDVTDEERLREVGDEGVRLLLSDSTNVDSHGTSASESVSREVLGRLIEESRFRVIVGLFASNVARLRALGEIAVRTRRRLVLLGRSVQTHARVARDQGRLPWPSDLVASPDELASLPRRDVIVVAGGTQAERQAALSRLASRSHQQLTLDPGDRVILSSRVIPGNEPAVVAMHGGFLRQGVEVRTPASDPGVHVSGHAYRDEQRRMIELTRPTSFVPVHGTVPHLHHHAALARDTGVGEVVVLENGEIAELGDVPLARTDARARFGKIATWAGEEIPPSVLDDRVAIARAGIVFVTVLVDGRGRPAGPVAIATRGILDESQDGDLVDEAAREVERALRERPDGRERPSDAEIAELARVTARRRLDLSVGKRPVAVASVIRVRA